MNIAKLNALAARLPDANLLNNSEQGYQTNTITIDGYRFHTSRVVAKFNNPDQPTITSVKAWHNFWVYNGTIEINPLPPQDQEEPCCTKLPLTEEALHIISDVINHAYQKPRQDRLRNPEQTAPDSPTAHTPDPVDPPHPA